MQASGKIDKIKADPVWPGALASELKKLETVQEEVLSFQPFTEQEKLDQEQVLHLLKLEKNLLYRDNLDQHFTASAWIINPDHSKVLMVWHNIYRSWSWIGGHADGDGDLVHVARREAIEESGVENLHLLVKKPISLEILPVAAHLRRGQKVNTHRHLNLTYLFEASEYSPLSVKPDENSAVGWILLEEIPQRCQEKKMLPIYQKLGDRLRDLG